MQKVITKCGKYPTVECFASFFSLSVLLPWLSPPRNFRVIMQLMSTYMSLFQESKCIKNKPKQNKNQKTKQNKKPQFPSGLH